MNLAKVIKFTHGIRLAFPRGAALRFFQYSHEDAKRHEAKPEHEVPTSHNAI